MRKSLSEIKVGDRVWVSDGHSNKWHQIQPVERLTATQIILPHDTRYYRTGKRQYWQVGRSMFMRRVTDVATPEECAEYDRAQEKRRLEIEAAQTKQEKI